MCGVKSQNRYVQQCLPAIFSFWLDFQCFLEFEIDKEIEQILIMLVPVEPVSLGFAHIVHHYASLKAKSLSQIKITRQPWERKLKHAIGNICLFKLTGGLGGCTVADEKVGA